MVVVNVVLKDKKLFRFEESEGQCTPSLLRGMLLMSLEMVDGSTSWSDMQAPRAIKKTKKKLKIEVRKVFTGQQSI